MFPKGVLIDRAPRAAEAGDGRDLGRRRGKDEGEVRGGGEPWGGRGWMRGMTRVRGVWERANEGRGTRGTTTNNNKLLLYYDGLTAMLGGDYRILW